MKANGLSSSPLAAPHPKDSRAWLVGGTILLALLGFTIVAVIMRRGMPISPDGWYYWQGSVSILNGLGYRDFSGDAIGLWPPGYSVYLAACQLVLGISARSIALSTALAVAASVATWSILLTWFARERGRSTGHVLCGLAFVSVVLALHTRSVRAENLLHVFLPLLILFALRARLSSTPRRFLLESGLACVVLFISLLIRNAAIAFWPAVLALLILNRTIPWQTRGVACGLFSAAVLGFWFLLRLWLGADWDPPIGLGAGRYEFAQYLLQLVSGIDRNTGLEFVGFPLIVLLAVSLWRVDEAQDGTDASAGLGRATLLFVAVAVCALLALFNSTWIYDKLNQRFTLFVTLAIGGLGLVQLPSLLRRRWLALVLIVLFAQPTLRLAKHTIRGRGQGRPDYVSETLSRFVPSRTTIDPEHIRRPPKRGGGRVLVSPRFPEGLGYPTVEP